MKKKLFSILISLMMVLTMMPMMAVVSYAETAPEPLCFTAEAANSSVKLRGQNRSLLYSMDGTEWNTYTIESEIKLPNVGDKVYFKAADSNNSFYDTYFSMVGRIAASGNIMSLLNSSVSLTEISSERCFSYLFANCHSLTKAPELPATKLKKDCYNGMFTYCTGLEMAPELPATKMEDFCYYNMFENDTSLIQTPELPATELAWSCYDRMFYKCKGLKKASDLRASTLKYECYKSMFEECTSLEQPPQIFATDLTDADMCCASMFKGCTNLSALPELSSTVLPLSCYAHMFDKCPKLTVSELGNTECYDTYRVPSKGDAVEVGSSALGKMVNGKTLQPGVTYYYSPHHKYVVKYEGKDSTCTAAGYKDYYYCDDCKLYFSDAEGKDQIADIDAWKNGDGKIATKPHSIKKVKGNYVCNGTGWKDYYKCEKCSTRFSDKDGKNEITNLVAWKAGAGKLVNPGHVVSEWFASKSYHFGECKYCGEAVTANHNGSPCGVCGYVASEVQDPEDDEEYILDEEETSDENGAVEGEEGENSQEVSSIFSNGTTWIVLVIGLAAIAGVAVLAIKKRD